jgi:hypothetical protein
MWSKGIVQGCGQKTWSKDVVKGIRVRAVRLRPSRGANPSQLPYDFALGTPLTGTPSTKQWSKDWVKEHGQRRGQRTWSKDVAQTRPQRPGSLPVHAALAGSGVDLWRILCQAVLQESEACWCVQRLVTLVLTETSDPPSRPASLRCEVPTGCLCNRSTASVLWHFQSPNPPISSLRSVVKSVHEAQPALCTRTAHPTSAQMPAQMPACFPRCLPAPSLSLRLWTVSVVSLSFRASTFHK